MLGFIELSLVSFFSRSINVLSFARFMSFYIEWLIVSFLSFENLIAKSHGIVREEVNLNVRFVLKSKLFLENLLANSLPV